MAIMNRNVNLEEINTDAFMGIPYLNYQTLPQKIIFVAGIVTGIVFNLLNSFIWNMGSMASIGITLAPLLIGIAFGCNYNEDLPLYKYFALTVSNPVRHFYSKPTEDLEQIRKKAEQIKNEEQRQIKEQQISDEDQRKLLKTLVVSALLFFVAIIATVFIIKSLKVEEVHHNISPEGAVMIMQDYAEV